MTQNPSQSSQPEDENEQIKLREEIRKRRIKNRKKFKSPLFIFLSVLTLLIFFVPRCTYKHNLSKMYERSMEQQEKAEHSKSSKQSSKYEPGSVMPRMGRE